MAIDIGTLAGNIELDDEFTGALTRASNLVTEFGERFDNAFGAIVIGAGAAVAAIGAVTAAVIGLGQRGSDINDVANTLDHFAGSAQRADEILENLRRGTGNVVTDFDLMRTSSRLLSAQVQLNVSDFATLGQAATVLSNRGLGDTKQMLDLVSNALVTGRTRTLAMSLGVVDNTNAQLEYAKSLGTTVDKLTQEQRTIATRISIMDMMRRAVADAGRQQADFGDLINQGTTALRNWFDALASRVADSPRVMTALTAVGNAVADAFGDRSQTALETIVSWIERFADNVTRYGPTVVAWAKNVYDAAAEFGPIVLEWLADIVQGLIDIATTVKNTWDAMPEWFQKAAGSAAIAGSAVYLFGGTAVAAGKDVLSLSNDIGTMISGFADAIVIVPKLKIALEGLSKFLAANALGVLVLAIGAGLATAAMSWNSYQEAQQENLDAIAEGYDQNITDFNSWLAEIDKGLRGQETNFRRWGAAEQKVLEENRRQMEAHNRVRDQLLGITPKVPITTGLNLSAVEAVTSALPTTALGKLLDPTAAVNEAATAQQEKQRQINILRQREIEAQAAAYAKRLEEVNKRIAEQIAATAGLTDAQEASVLMYRAMGLSNEEIATKLNITSAAVRHFVTELEIAARARADAQQKEIERQKIIESEALEALNRESVGFQRAEALRNQIRDANEERELTSFNVRRAQLARWVESEKRAYVSVSGYSREYYEALVDQAAEAIEAVIAKEELEPYFAWLADQLQRRRQQILQNTEALQSMTNAAASLVGLPSSNLATTFLELTDALNPVNEFGEPLERNWRQVGNAIAATAVQVVGLIKTFDQATSSASRLANTINGAITGAQAGSAFGPWGALIGAIGGSILGAMREPQEAIEEVMNRYGLSLDMLMTTADRARRTIEDVQRLTIEGFIGQRGRNVLAEQMVDPLNELIEASFTAGVVIPRNLAPVLISLIKMGKITEENARRLLGMAESTMPSLEELNEIAERYGLTLEDLGPAAKQLDITARANQIVKDFERIAKAGLNIGAVMGAAKDDIQELVNAALRSGFELPESMRPWLQAMVDAGELVDENGTKLENLSRINFAKPLTEAVDELIEAIMRLIDTMAGPHQMRVRVVEVDQDGNELPGSGRFAGPRQPEPAGTMVSGSNATMLAPAGTGMMTINQILDGRVITSAIVPYIPEVVADLGLVPTA